MMYLPKLKVNYERFVHIIRVCVEVTCVSVMYYYTCTIVDR